MKRSTKIRIFRQGASTLFYPAAPPLPAKTLTYLAWVIRRHRKKIGWCWRKLNPGRQALLVLAYLREGETEPGHPALDKITRILPMSGRPPDQRQPGPNTR